MFISFVEPSRKQRFPPISPLCRMTRHQSGNRFGFDAIRLFASTLPCIAFKKTTRAIWFLSETIAIDILVI